MLSYMEQNMNNTSMEDSQMLSLNASLLFGLAAVISACASLVWSIRRRG
jgi:hypothetical protein